jgi:methylated-DNA-[protein]-cysteine S-methyltransferase
VADGCLARTRAGRYIRRVATRHVRYAVDGWGTGELVFADGVLAWHELPRAGGGANGSHPLAERLTAYFAGATEPFDEVELELDWCTGLQRAAVEAMRAIPYGETATYGEIAALAGHPNAQRAVGSVCAGNRFGVVVPCHRVVAADGLGSYGSLGVGYKRRLLELEGVAL